MKKFARSRGGQAMACVPLPIFVCSWAKDSFTFIYFVFLRAAPAAYGGAQARGLIRAIAAGLHHCHRNTSSELHLPPHHSSWQHRILNPPSEAMDQTHNLMVPSRICFLVLQTVGRKKSEEAYILWHVKIIRNSSFSIQKSFIGTHNPLFTEYPQLLLSDKVRAE